MLETAQVSSTVQKFASPLNASSATSSSSTSRGGGGGSGSAEATAAAQIKSEDKSDLLGWDCDQFPDSATKYSPIKLEVSDTFDSIVLSSSGTSGSGGGSSGSGGDFAELKPLPYDYGVAANTTATTSATNGTDPVLANNNNSKGMTDLNASSPPTTVSTTGPPAVAATAANSSFASSDVTSTASTSSAASSSSSPPGITKLETLDFTASQDAFDDLASIVGISMGADSTVPNMDGDMDLDAWIETTAQNIKPLDASMESLLPNRPYQLQQAAAAAAAVAAAAVANGGPSGSTLQSLLQGNLTPGPPPQSAQQQPAAKVTQLQQREQPPPYSILQNRLQHGGTCGGSPHQAPSGPPTQLHLSGIIKVDSTFDLMKMAAAAAPNSPNSVSYAVSYADSLPHSTQTPLNHVTTSGDHQSLHRRLGELGGLAKIKAKQNKMRQKLGLVSGTSAGGAAAPGSAAAAALAGAGGDQSKKMMHHCQICNRGFLNKSNIKVHLRTHTGEKPFKCEHCAKAFRQKAHLLKHMSIHKRISRD